MPPTALQFGNLAGECAEMKSSSNIAKISCNNYRPNSTAVVHAATAAMQEKHSLNNDAPKHLASIEGHRLHALASVALHVQKPAQAA